MKHNYNSENRCVNCGAYRDAVMAGNLVCYIPREPIELRPPMTEYVPGTEPRLYTELEAATMYAEIGVRLPPGMIAGHGTRLGTMQKSTHHEPVSLGGRVKLLAQAAGLTETGAAAVMNCTVHDVAMIVTGKQDITSDQLMALAVETVKQVYKSYQES